MPKLEDAILLLLLDEQFGAKKAIKVARRSWVSCRQPRGEFFRRPRASVSLSMCFFPSSCLTPF